jgi:putative Holliday junction resolvase
MRILAIDPGEKRVGLAVSDELGITAQGLETFDRKSGQSFIAFLSDLIERYEVYEIVVGFPISLSGEKGKEAQKAEDLASRIRSSLRVKVTLWDERYTSKQAERVLRGSRNGKEAVDKISAIIILQSYLDFLGNSSFRGNNENDKN